MLGLLNRMFEDTSPVTTSNMGVNGLDTHIISQAKPEIQRLARLPGHVSRSAVIEEARETSKVEAAAKLLQKYAQLRQRRINATVNLYRTAAQHQQGVLRANKQMVQVDERYGRFMEEYLTDVGTTKASLDGYQQGFQSARTLVG